MNNITKHKGVHPIMPQIKNIKHFIKSRCFIEDHSLYLKGKIANIHMKSFSTLSKIIGDKFDIPQYYLDKAIKRGRWVHKQIEIYYSENLQYERDHNHINDNYMTHFFKFHEKYKLNPIELEFRVADEVNEISGIIDFLGIYTDENEIDKLVIIDWKTSAKINPYWVGLQLYFYKKLLSANKIFVDELWVVGINKDKYQLIKIDPKYFPIYEETFWLLMRVYDYMQIVQLNPDYENYNVFEDFRSLLDAKKFMEQKY